MIATPPADTRAWLRGKIVEKFSRQITGADWSYIQLQNPDRKSTLVYRLEFPNPLVGTERDLAPVWDHFRTPAQMFAYFYALGHDDGH
jgi:proteasome accessory factor A